MADLYDVAVRMEHLDLAGVPNGALSRTAAAETALRLLVTAARTAQAMDHSLVLYYDADSETLNAFFLPDNLGEAEEAQG